jgi:hypothetical protein
MDWRIVYNISYEQQPCEAIDSVSPRATDIFKSLYKHYFHVRKGAVRWRGSTCFQAQGLKRWNKKGMI